MSDSGLREPGLGWSAEGNSRGHRGRRLARYIWRPLILIVIPVGLITVAVAGSLATYRAVQSAEGHGTKGYFVDVQGALGEFRLPDGQITRLHVTFADPPPALRTGAVIPALDTGDVTYVFARHGSRHWETDVGVLSSVVLAFGAWLWFVPLRIRHKRRGGPVFAHPASGSGRAVPAATTTVMSAAADPVWAKSWIGLLNGDVSTRRVNTALQDAADSKAFPLLVTVGIPLTDTDRMMYGVSGESDRFRVLTDTVTGLIAGHGVLAASVADRSAWVFLIYTSSTEWLAAFGNRMRSELADHLVAFGARRDPAWRAYRELWRIAPRKLRTRERIALVVLVPLLFAVAAARYGPAWVTAIFVFTEAWVLTVAFARRDRLIPAQLAHPVISGLAVTGVLWTALFPLGSVVVHPSSPWVCATGAAVVAIAIVLAGWPAQRRYLTKMRASGALQPPGSPTP
jgi:hypothetical protein